MTRTLKQTMVCVFAVLSALTMLVGPVPATAGDYPAKPIRMIYPFPAGSGGDIGTRILAEAISKELGKPIKVSNVTGGRGTIGAAKVAKARKDGYVIGSLPIGPALTQPVFSHKLPYRTGDLVPVCNFTYLPIVLVAPANAPFKTTKELIAYAKKNPGKVKYAHPGLYSVPHMMVKALESSAGVQLKGVPFKGLRPGVTATVGGHVELALAVAAEAIGFQKAGKLTILGVFASKRMKLLPTVPTMDEGGVKDYPMLWTGIFVPKGTDAAVIKKLGDAIAKVVNSEKFKAAMLKAKMPVLYMDQAAFAANIWADMRYFHAYRAKRGK